MVAARAAARAAAAVGRGTAPPSRRAARRASDRPRPSARWHTGTGRGPCWSAGTRCAPGGASSCAARGCRARPGGRAGAVRMLLAMPSEDWHVLEATLAEERGRDDQRHPAIADHVGDVGELVARAPVGTRGRRRQPPQHRPGATPAVRSAAGCAGASGAGRCRRRSAHRPVAAGSRARRLHAASCAGTLPLRGAQRRSQRQAASATGNRSRPRRVRRYSSRGGAVL